MEEWDTEMRWREEEDDWFFHLAAVENQLHLLATAPVQEMVTLVPADAKNSSSSVQFERTRSAPLTDRLETFMVDVAEGREEEEVDGKGEQEKRTREEMKTHSRRLILRKPS